jgi:hypothetical protein
MTKLAKVTVVVFIAAGIASLGLMAGGKHQGARARREVDRMRGYYPAPMPQYPGVKEYPMGSSLSVGSSPLKMSYFFTPDDTLRVASFYAAQWNAAGHYVTEDISPSGGIVSAYDPGKGILRQVLIKRQPDRTAVYPSLLAEPLRPATGNHATSLDVPLYPGAEGVLRFGARDPGHRSKVTLYTNYGGLVNNVDFFRTRLPEQGWKEVKSKAPAVLPANTNQTLTFHKGRRELTVNLTQMDSEGRVRVHIAEATGQELGYPGKPPAKP